MFVYQSSVSNHRKLKGVDSDDLSSIKHIENLVKM
jgi:hypothetical protein